MKKIIIPPYTRWKKFRDWCWRPFMYVAAGTMWESPQETHRYNNMKLQAKDVLCLKKKGMVSRPGLERRSRWWGIFPIFHIPIFGGWREYVVLSPVRPVPEWFVGWIAEDVIGISMLPLKGLVRVLRGDRGAQWFGIDREGNQISLKVVGKGKVGAGGRFARYPFR